MILIVAHFTMLFTHSLFEALICLKLFLKLCLLWFLLKKNLFTYSRLSMCICWNKIWPFIIYMDSYYRRSWFGMNVLGCILVTLNQYGTYCLFSLSTYKCLCYNGLESQYWCQYRSMESKPNTTLMIYIGINW